MSASLPDPEILVAQLAAQMRGKLAPDAALVGIYTGGVWVAERLHRLLAMSPPLGTLAVTLHRDDFSRIGLHREAQVRVALKVARGGVGGNAAAKSP